MTDPDRALVTSAARPRRAWSPEGGVEAAEMLRLLALRPWLIAGRDDDAMAKIRQNLPEITSALAALAGRWWSSVT